MHHLTPILPCRSRDDASEQRPSPEADELLAACTALWHPALVAEAGGVPKWMPAAEPPDDPDGHLLLIPPAAEPLLAEDWLEHAEQSGAKLIRGKRTRAEMIAAALALVDAPPAVDDDLAADFLALGYCHYVVETITVNIRYVHSLDEDAFSREVVAAAEAACGGDGETARARLQAAFDLLHTAREYSYPSESYLLDLTLVAGSTIGQSLRTQLDGRAKDDVPCNLLLSGKVLEQMAAREPATLEALRRAIHEGTASVVGGEYEELELPLLPIEAVRSEFVKGLAVHEKHLAVRPTVFARRRFGMTPLLPQILDNLGFTGAVHATLDDGRFPTAGASRQRWEGLDDTTIEALLRVPVDAAGGEGFVRLPHSISGAADMDNQPTAVFAHWPGRASCWYEDVRRTRRYTSVLGTFRTLPEYFERTGMSGHQTSFRPDNYRSPYLAQAVAAGEPDPISRWQRHYARYASDEAAETLAALSVIAGGQVSGTLRVPLAAGTRSVPDTFSTDFARAVGGQPGATAAIMVINPLSASRRVCLDVSALSALPDVSGAVLQAGETAGRKSAIVEIPPLGFAVVRAGPGQAASSPPRRRFGFFRTSQQTSPPLAERDSRLGGAVLRNEFFEVVIDPRFGAVRAIYDFQSRGPRLAQQIAMRLEDREEEDAYSVMAADEVRVIQAGPLIGEVAVRGRLMDRAGQPLADFRQTTRVAWGSRVIEVEAEIDPHREPGGDPWISYYAARFAWGQDVPALHRGVNQATVSSEAARLESPQFVEIRGPSPREGASAARTTILTAGLPYHHRSGLRKLDTLLIVRGETARRFRFGIGIDLPQPQAAALEFLAPSPLASLAALPKSESAWLFHLDSRAVVATHWEPIIEDGAVSGARARLLETEGRHVTLGLRSFRAVKSARKLGGHNRAADELDIAGDTVNVPFRSYEWAEVEVRWR
jgi:alpha-mannosidase